MCRSHDGGGVLAAWAASRGHKVDLDGDDSITEDKAHSLGKGEEEEKINICEICLGVFLSKN
jgi:hypothetical protein